MAAWPISLLGLFSELKKALLNPMTDDDENHNEYDNELTIERFKRENPNWTEKEILDYFNQ